MNKRCLRMLAGFLVLVMLLTMIGGAMAEEPDLPKLDLLMLDVIEYSVAEWWESDSQKALLSVCAYIDIVLSENADWAKIAEEAV